MVLPPVVSATAREAINPQVLMLPRPKLHSEDSCLPSLCAFDCAFFPFVLIRDLMLSLKKTTQLPSLLEFVIGKFLRQSNSLYGCSCTCVAFQLL